MTTAQAIVAGLQALEKAVAERSDTGVVSQIHSSEPTPTLQVWSGIDRLYAEVGGGWDVVSVEMPEAWLWNEEHDCWEIWL